MEAKGLEPSNLLTASQALYQLSYAPVGRRHASGSPHDSSPYSRELSDYRHDVDEETLDPVWGQPPDLPVA